MFFYPLMVVQRCHRCTPRDVAGHREPLASIEAGKPPPRWGMVSLLGQFVNAHEPSSSPPWESGKGLTSDYGNI